MKYAVITPAYDEALYVSNTLQSMCAQTHKPHRWIIVDDGSSDATVDIVEHYIRENPWAFLLRNLFREPRAQGPKVVRAFNLGLETLDLTEYDFIVKLDADISLPANYFEVVATIFKESSKIGICGGVSRIMNGKRTQKINAGFDHVHGQVKSYRCKCFNDIGGLPMVHGWDILDEHLANYHGWEVKSIENLEFIHHRVPVRNLGALRRSYDAGRWYYQMSYGLPATIGYAIQQSFRSPVLIAWIPTLIGYFHALINGMEPFVDSKTGTYIRKQMNRRLIAYLKSILFIRNRNGRLSGTE